MEIIVGIICLAVGAGLAYFFLAGKSNSKLKSANEQIESARGEAERITSEARRQADTAKKEAVLEAKEEILQLKQNSEAEEKKRKGELQSMEGRIMQREESLDRRNDALDKRERQLSGLQSQLDRRKNDLDALEGKQTTELERIAGLSKDEAHDELIARVRAESVRDEAQILRESEQNVRAKADKTAREIISTAIQRCAADQAGEITVTTVHIPSDDLKGRIIGREGRNIRTFEQVSGVSLVIDDTPETVVLSSFDPVRRETARVALENLIADGRIHPARIEELYKKAEDLVNERVREAGEQAAFDAGIHDLHPEIVKTLGALKYRTSFGQNVLSHSVQVSALCGIMASELGMDPAPAKRAGLLHDIGKAIDHEVEGSHVAIGVELAKKYRENAEVIHAIEAHHGDVEAHTVVACLVQAADAISAARPGARRENLEAYIKRLEKLEELAESFDGVEKSFAIQAGREIRIIVKPDIVKDDEMILLARDLAKKIEDEMSYPGQIKVHVVRETRAIEYAK